MKKRMDYLDVAKGIAIFLVVMGHAALAFFVYGTALRPGEQTLVGMFSFQYGNLFWFFCGRGPMDVSRQKNLTNWRRRSVVLSE